jgi:predicted regulator of Ras-like GTPase activity (Roadblock/LC7/MglB family)
MKAELENPMTSPVAFPTTYNSLKTLLDDLNTQGRYTLTVLTDENGLPIAASTGDEDDIEMQAAVVSRVQKIISQIKPQLGMGATDEISLNDVNGKKLVCRTFEANGSEFTLAILVDSRDRAYRRLTNKTIIQIQRMNEL